MQMIRLSTRTDIQFRNWLGSRTTVFAIPIMPKAAFADMWFTLKQGEPWSGIVKNLRKDGDHYWVRANARCQ